MDGGRQTTSRRPRQAALDHQRQAAADSRQGHQQDWVAGVPESAIGAGFRVDGMLLIPSPVQCGPQVASRVGMARTSLARRPKSAADLQSELSAEASRCRGPGRSTARRIGPVPSFGRAVGACSGSISHWTITPLTSAWCRDPTAFAPHARTQPETKAPSSPGFRVLRLA